MLLIMGTFNIDPARRADFTAAAITMQQASQAEAGCQHYVFTADLEDANVVHIAERWTDEASLVAHFESEHMAAFGKAVAGAMVGGGARKYEVSSEGPVR